MAEPQGRATGQRQAAISAPSVTSRLRSYSLGTFLFPFKVCIYHQSTPLKCMHTALFLPKFPSASWSREQRLPLMCEHSEDPTAAEPLERLSRKVLVYLNCKTQPRGFGSCSKLRRLWKRIRWLVYEATF